MPERAAFVCFSPEVPSAARLLAVGRELHRQHLPRKAVLTLLCHLRAAHGRDLAGLRNWGFGPLPCEDPAGEDYYRLAPEGCAWRAFRDPTAGIKALLSEVRARPALYAAAKAGDLGTYADLLGESWGALPPLREGAPLPLVAELAALGGEVGRDVLRTLRPAPGTDPLTDPLDVPRRHATGLAGEAVAVARTRIARTVVREVDRGVAKILRWFSG